MQPAEDPFVEQVYRWMILPVFGVCLFGLTVLTKFHGPLAGLVIIVPTMLFWHTIRPRPVTILIHFLMSVLVMGTNAVLLLALFLRMTLKAAFN